MPYPAKEQIIRQIKEKSAQICHMSQHLTSIRLRYSAFILAVLMLASLPSCRVQKNSGPKKKATNRTQATSKTVKQVLQAAKSYTGTPYKYGGTNRNGIDCSALMQNAFKEAGINLPRSSKEQSNVGVEVEKKNLTPGDLVFFSDSRVGSGITHVGLVTEILENGDVRFIHSSTKLGVTENLLSGTYYIKTYARARRIF
jgi:cell wall-associated NlpC family hydrolase